MSELSLTLMTITRVIVFTVGIAITGVGYQAYRRNRTGYLRKVVIGFGIVSIGVFLEGLLYHGVGFDLVTVHIAESVVICIGFLVLLSSFRE